MSLSLHFDTVGGAAGDMIVGALLDLDHEGVDITWLEGALRALDLPDFRVSLERVARHGITAAKFRVTETQPAAHDHDHGGGGGHGHHGHGAHAHRHYADIRRMIEAADLPAGARRIALDAFRALAEAEGKVHGVAADAVAFHEVGAVDSIVDIVGAALCLDRLGAPRCTASPLPVNPGFVHSAHGQMPLPAPATALLLQGIPVVAVPGDVERVTPTGAALLKTIVSEWTPFPSPAGGVVIRRVAYGAGDRDDKDRPNLLRVFEWEPAGEAGAAPGSGRTRETLAVIETNLDDATPEQIGYAMDRLLAAGALDVFVVPMVGKKSRPGHLLTVLAREPDEGRLVDLLFHETPTLGVRVSRVAREALPRTQATVETPWGPIRVKIAVRAGGQATVHAEYEDVAEAARRSGVPYAQVQAEAERAARSVTG